MKKPYLCLSLLTCFLSFFYGTAVGKYKVFPYFLMKKMKETIAPDLYLYKPNTSTANAHKLFQVFSPKADVAFIGDSLTDAANWNEFFPNLNVVNRGVGGDGAADIRRRLESIISTNPTKAYIMVGINDIYQYVSNADILENYSFIVDSLIGSDIEVVIQSTIQCELSKCGAKFVDTINNLNNSLVKLASEKEVNFLNLGALSDQNGLNSKYTIDGVHLSAEGYIYWVDKLFPTMANLKIESLN